MHGVQARAMTDRELVKYCLAQLELTTTALSTDVQIELVHRLQGHVERRDHEPIPTYTRTRGNHFPDVDGEED